MHTVTRNIGGRDLVIETGRVARQAHGAVLVRYGGTEVLVTAVRAKPREGLDFFPLSVDYREMTYAAGKFPGGFFKREGRPTLKETLTSRLIDRPCRPLFPEGYKDEVQICAKVLSADKVNDPDILAVIGASASLVISPIPFQGPIGTVRVGQIDGAFVVNPTTEQLAESDFNIIVAASADGVVMVEGEASEVDEDTMVKAIEFGFQEAQTIIQMQEELVTAAGKPKTDFQSPDDSALRQQLNGKYPGEMERRSFIEGKEERSLAMSELRDQMIEENVTDDGPARDDIVSAFNKIEEEVVRKGILGGKRPDGRGPKDIRNITCEIGFLAKTHGSALFTRGETQAMAVTTLGTTMDEQKIDGLEEEHYESFILHYNFPPFSVGEVKPMRGPSRRDMGHGNLAARSLSAIMPDKETFPYTVRVVSEILESNGSSSMATVCSSTLSMMDAGIPIARPVAGIAMGLVLEGGQSVILTDIAGAEDHFGDMDLKVAGSQKGITGLQMDIKVGSIPVSMFAGMFAQAKEARLDILRSMLSVLSEPRKHVSSNAPKLTRIMINPELIGTLIGPRGKVIKALQEETGAKVEVSDDGSVVVSCEEQTGMDEALERIKAITIEINVGDIFEAARVVSIREGLGAFVELAPGKDALLHVSEVANEFVKDVKDHIKENDKVRVKVIRKDDQGKIRVSIKALL